VYLQHQELNGAGGKEISFLLKKENRYVIYLLNPSKQFPQFAVKGSNGAELKDLLSLVNKKEKVMSCIFTPGESGAYTFSYYFENPGEACVLMAIYLQNITLYKAGVYKSFNELRYNNPSAALQGDVVSRTDQAGKQKVMFYSLKMKKSEAKDHVKVYGFSDGSAIYLKRKEGIGIPQEFVRIDNYGMYGYFEDIAYVSTGSAMVPFLTMNLVNMNTGEIKRVDRKHLRDLLADEPDMLKGFDQEPQKDKMMKDYLIRYLEKKSGVSMPVKK
jgi:hypothetical protein